MRKSLFVLLLGLSFLVLPHRLQQNDEVSYVAPLIPDTAAAEEIEVDEAKAVVEATLTTGQSLPSRLIIPSIQLNSPIQHLGLNAKGEMDVPDGRTNKVGWYKYGTVPGNTGSAVLDAHVYAAFKNLKNVKIGEHIYVVDREGRTLDFIVRDSHVYPLAKVPADFLFNRADSQRLNLITCAGTFIRSAGTYDHRLIVSAELVN